MNIKHFKILIDIFMYLDFIYLMNEGVSHSLTAHAVCGIVLFCLFIVHHILNLWFYKSLSKGRWNADRVVFTVTDWLLFALMILMAASSVMMSGLVFEFSPVHTTQSWRTVHLASSSWCFVVMSLHLGFHTEKPLKKLEKRLNKLQKLIFYVLLFIILGAGVFAFVKTQLYVYMFCTGGWKMAASGMLYGFIEYTGITAGICAGVKIEER